MTSCPYTDKIARALNIAKMYGMNEGDHHREWVIDQMVRALADDYEQWVRNYCDGEDGPNTYHWGEGVAP